ncbi:hypothetical protein [Methylobacterium sp. JK268]
MNVDVLFSCIFAEDIDFLKLYIQNFLHFTDDACGLVINLGRDDDLSPLGDVPPRIRIHVGATPRSKVGPTLLIGHLENLDLAERQGSTFAYFCTLASNALFVRRTRACDIPGAMTLGAGDPFACSIDRLPDDWHWPSVASDTAFVAYCRSAGFASLRMSQIEGLCASRSDWNRIAAHRPFLDDAARREVQTFPYEEILPATVLTAHPTVRFGILCYNFWERFATSGGAVRFDDLLRPAESRDAPSSMRGTRVCAMKRFQRDPADPLTAFLCGSGAAAHLDAIHDIASRGPDDPVGLFYREALQALLTHREAVDLFSLWRANGSAEAICLYADAACPPARRIEALPAPAGNAAPYLYFEGVTDVYGIAIDVAWDGRSHVLRSRCRPAGSGGDLGIIVAYLYVPAYAATGSTVIVTARSIDRSGAAIPALGRLTYCYKGQYAVLQELADPAEALDAPAPDRKTFRGDLPIAAVDGRSEVYVGVPIVSGIEAEFRVAVRRSPIPDAG